jgi:hypothetical protein
MHAPGHFATHMNMEGLVEDFGFSTNDPFAFDILGSDFAGILPPAPSYEDFLSGS